MRGGEHPSQNSDVSPPVTVWGTPPRVVEGAASGSRSDRHSTARSARHGSARLGAARRRGLVDWVVRTAGAHTQDMHALAHLASRAAEADPFLDGDSPVCIRPHHDPPRVVVDLSRFASAQDVQAYTTEALSVHEESLSKRSPAAACPSWELWLRDRFRFLEDDHEGSVEPDARQLADGLFEAIAMNHTVTRMVLFMPRPRRAVSRAAIDTSHQFMYWLQGEDPLYTDDTDTSSIGHQLSMEGHASYTYPVVMVRGRTATTPLEIPCAIVYLGRFVVELQLDVDLRGEDEETTFGFALAGDTWLECFASDGVLPRLERLTVGTGALLPRELWLLGTALDARLRLYDAGSATRLRALKFCSQFASEFISDELMFPSYGSFRAVFTDVETLAFQHCYLPRYLVNQALVPAMCVLTSRLRGLYIDSCHWRDSDPQGQGPMDDILSARVCASLSTLSLVGHMDTGLYAAAFSGWRPNPDLVSLVLADVALTTCMQETLGEVLFDTCPCLESLTLARIRHTVEASLGVTASRELIGAAKEDARAGKLKDDYLDDLTPFLLRLQAVAAEPRHPLVLRQLVLAENIYNRDSWDMVWALANQLPALTNLSLASEVVFPATATDPTEVVVSSVHPNPHHRCFRARVRLTAVRLGARISFDTATPNGMGMGCGHDSSDASASLLGHAHRVIGLISARLLGTCITTTTTRMPENDGGGVALDFASAFGLEVYEMVYGKEWSKAELFSPRTPRLGL